MNCIIASSNYGAGVLLRCPVCALPSERLRCTPTAATRFVKAQVTTLHFPQAENSDCILAFPLPTKQALWGPFVFLPLAALPSLPRIEPPVLFRPAYKKADIHSDICFFGAGNRNRTGTDFTPRDFLTTIAFATQLVCGLDHAFTCSRWSVSGLYTFQGFPWLGSALPLSKVSPNLLTFRIVIPGYLLYSLTDRIFVTNGN